MTLLHSASMSPPPQDFPVPSACSGKPSASAPDPSSPSPMLLSCSHPHCPHDHPPSLPSLPPTQASLCGQQPSSISFHYDSEPFSASLLCSVPPQTTHCRLGSDGRQKGAPKMSSSCNRLHLSTNPAHHFPLYPSTCEVTPSP